MIDAIDSVDIINLIDHIDHSNCIDCIDCINPIDRIDHIDHGVLNYSAKKPNAKNFGMNFWGKNKELFEVIDICNYFTRSG